MREFWGWVVFALAVGLILAGYLWEPPAPRHVPAASVAATPLGVPVGKEPMLP
jgi:hypothetical protein